MTSDTPGLLLYGRQDCHLCDLAEQMLLQVRPPPHYDKIDIDGNLDLLRHYGSSIPVLRASATGAELHWSFTVDSLQRWLTSQQQQAS